MGHFKGVGKVYLQAVVDTFSSYAFGLLATSKQPETAALLLHNEVLPFYTERQIPISALLTDNGREFCGTEAHPYELYLALNDIEHRRTQVRRPQTNGFVERFNRTVLEEFFREVFRERFYESVEALQQDLDRWLQYYNTERPHQGYRNQGRRPIETIELYLRAVPEDACEYSLGAMLTFWVWPRTLPGLLLLLTVGPVLYLLGLAVAEGTLLFLSRQALITRFHRRLEESTRREAISPLRILVFLIEALLLLGIVGLLVWGITSILGERTHAIEEFWNRHFWP